MGPSRTGWSSLPQPEDEQGPRTDEAPRPSDPDVDDHPDKGLVGTVWVGGVGAVLVPSATVVTVKLKE